MPRNVYFSQAVRSEQSLYEDLVIESLKIFGQDVYYIPRSLVERDTILGEDPASKFDDAYLIEAYIENQDSFEGAGDLYQKFGLEIRDEANFIISKRQWENLIGLYNNTLDNVHKPKEGDIIFLPMSNSFFEITFVEHEQPFYQLSNLPVYKLTCSLFEYSEEQFDTGLNVIDDMAAINAYQTTIVVDVTANAHFTKGEIVSQTLVAASSDYSVGPPLVGTAAIVVSGTISGITKNSTTGATITVINVGVTGSSGEMREFTVSASIGLVGAESGNTCFINDVADVADATSFEFDGQSQNYAFELEADGFLDFTESNPFGDPSETY
jgi:hypothetical protein|tara:strand:- start:1603 stop:2577 length:975 start_codon:yes stop_codon:yes gene_type:complete